MPCRTRSVWTPVGSGPRHVLQELGLASGLQLQLCLVRDVWGFSGNEGFVEQVLIMHPPEVLQPRHLGHHLVMDPLEGSVLQPAEPAYVIGRVVGHVN